MEVTAVEKDQNDGRIGTSLGVFRASSKCKLAATLAPTHKFKFGLLGVGLCIVSTYGMVTIQNLRGGFPLSLHDEVIRLGFIAGLVGVTGLGGCAGVAAIGWRGEVKVSEDLVSRHIAEHEME